MECCYHGEGVVWIKEQPHECQDPGFPARTLSLSMLFTWSVSYNVGADQCIFLYVYKSREVFSSHINTLFLRICFWACSSTFTFFLLPSLPLVLLLYLPLSFHRSPSGCTWWQVSKHCVYKKDTDTEKDWHFRMMEQKGSYRKVAPKSYSHKCACLLSCTFANHCHQSQEMSQHESILKVKLRHLDGPMVTDYNMGYEFLTLQVVVLEMQCVCQIFFAKRCNFG